MVKQSKGKKALKTTGKALKGFARGALSAGAQILGAGATALNPTRRRKRNADHKDSDHPIEVTKHWRAGPPGYLTPWQRAHHAGQHDLFEHGIKPAKKRNPSGFYELIEKYGAGQRTLKRSKSVETLRKERAKLSDERKQKTWVEDSSGNLIEGHRLLGWRPNPQRRTKKAKRNASGTVHAARAKTSGRRAARKASRKAATKTALRSVAKTRKSPAPRASARAKRNPSAESIRKTFAGSVSGSRDLYFPKGTPQGLAKLGKLVLIQTERGTIKPVHGSAWLCADRRGKLHIGSTTNAPLFDGPKQSFGKVKRIEYEDVKKHLGYTEPTVFFHHVGEENGIRPTLHADGKGGLIFKGGDYRITSRGLEN